MGVVMETAQRVNYGEHVPQSYELKHNSADLHDKQANAPRHR